MVEEEVEQDGQNLLMVLHLVDQVEQVVVDQELLQDQVHIQQEQQEQLILVEAEEVEQEKIVVIKILEQAEPAVRESLS
jgi:hypothetical protein